MKIIVPLQSLRDAVAAVAAIAPAKPSQRALACIRIDVAETIALRATDLMTFARVSVIGDVTRPGSCLVEAKALADIVRVLPSASATVTLEVPRGATKLHISCGNAKRNVGTIPVEEYPEWPPELAVTSTVNAADLRRAIQVVQHAASADEARPQLSSLRLGVEGAGDQARMVLVATDGHRLALTSIPCERPFDALIPIKSASALLRVVGDEEIRIGTDGAQYVGVKSETCDVVVRSMDVMMFPPWTQVIPARSKTRAIVSREILVSALRNVELAARTRLKDAGVVSTVSVSMADGAIVLHGANDAGDEADDRIDCDYAGTEMTFGVNAIYLLDALSAMAADELVVDIEGPLAPIRIEPRSDDPSLFIVMPTRI